MRALRPSLTCTIHFCTPSRLPSLHRATALAERISAFIEQRLALEAAALELEEEEQYEQYQDDVAPHGGQRQVSGQGGLG